MHRLVVLLAALLLPLTASAGIQAKAPDSAAKEYFEIACELSELDCKGLKAPTVLVVDMRDGLMGFYFYGTDIVFVTDQCLTATADRTKCDAVVIHEVVHYIFDQPKNRKRDPKGCLTESIAWEVYNRYVSLMNREDLLRINWRGSYPQCEK